MSKLPGEGLAHRPLHFIWICDCSGSMGVDGKIQSLNNAIKEAIPHMQSVANENPSADVLVRSVKFSNGAQWHIATPVKVSDFRWQDLTAEGITDMGKALRLVADQLKVPPMQDRALPPVLVLISDGQPTDDFKGGLKELKAQQWGIKAVRIAIAIGDDADLQVLQEFVGTNEIPVLRANNPEALVRYIRWVSTAVLKSASQPPSQAAGVTAPGLHVPIPAAPDLGPGTADDVW